MTLYQSYINTASRDDLAVLKPDWWARTSGIPLSEIQRWISDRIKDLDDQDIIRARPEVVPE